MLETTAQPLRPHGRLAKGGRCARHLRIALARLTPWRVLGPGRSVHMPFLWLWRPSGLARIEGDILCREPQPHDTLGARMGIIYSTLLIAWTCGDVLYCGWIRAWRPPMSQVPNAPAGDLRGNPALFAPCS